MSFDKLDIDKKTKFIEENLLCFSCLYQGHIIKFCRIKKRCELCRKLHPITLHDKYENKKEENHDITSRKLNSKRINKEVIKMPIIPVK